MNAQAQKEFQKLEDFRTSLFQSLQGLDEAVLQHTEKGKGWNTLQVIDHLLISERKSIAYIKKKMEYSDSLSTSNFSNRINATLLQGILKVPIKFRAPKGVEQVRTDLKLVEVEEEYNQIRAALKTILEDIPEEMMNQNLFRHPLLGRMNIMAALGFFNSHFERHSKQITRIQKDYRS
ncbi:MAG: hypothetical protein ACI959_000214 [Limisphaerales bacterium]|jgi:hypothetical protein